MPSGGFSLDLTVIKLNFRNCGITEVYSLRKTEGHLIDIQLNSNSKLAVFREHFYERMNIIPLIIILIRPRVMNDYLSRYNFATCYTLYFVQILDKILVVN